MKDFLKSGRFRDLALFNTGWIGASCVWAVDATWAKLVVMTIALAVYFVILNFWRVE